MGAQFAAPRAALTLAMIAPPSAMETNERRKLVLKKRHRGTARLGARPGGSA